MAAPALRTHTRAQAPIMAPPQGAASSAGPAPHGVVARGLEGGATGGRAVQAAHGSRRALARAPHHEVFETRRPILRLFIPEHPPRNPRVPPVPAALRER